MTGRALRRLLATVGRLLTRARDPGLLSRLFAEPPAEPAHLRLFIIAPPGSEAMVRANVRTLAGHCELYVLLNGYSRRAARRLAPTLSPATAVRLSALSGFPVKHGTALSLLLGAANDDFGVLDPDCFVQDPRLVRRPPFAENELLAAPDHPHFSNVNRVTGRRFPRTHFLIFNAELMRGVMQRWAIDAEKVVRPPRRLRAALATEGYGVHNYPRSHLRQFDTLLLLLVMAFHDGLEVRWLPATAEQILHWKHQARLAYELRAGAGAAARGAGGSAAVASPGARPAAAVPETVLLCHSHLDRFSGSEIAALELAEAFRDAGARVSLMTRRLRNPLARELVAGGFELFHPGAEPPPGVRFDLVIVFHRDMQRWLDRYRIGSGRRVFYSLSPSSLRATPPPDRRSYDRILAVSAETGAVLARLGVEDIGLLPNWAGEEMFALFGPRPCRLERVLCVSNHLPDELRGLRRALRPAAVRVDFVGRRSGGRVRRVDARLLGRYDLVVTIGKTVQYALAAGIPVYCYDRWGGHGYLAPTSLDHAEATNFSGRCCGRRLTADQIAAEIRAGFEAAFAGREELHREAHRRYRLKTNLERLY